MRLRGALGALLTALWMLPGAARAERTVVVLLFDGLAPALVEAFDTPHLDALAARGTSTHTLHPAFPTVSLINGITISTGCWPEHHGVVANLFLDPERGRYDHSRDADWLLGCEHLHQVAERQGVRAAALDWYGARSSERGDLASVTVAHDHWEDQPQDPDRAREVVELLGRPEPERPRLVLAYFRGPDAAAHFTGMDSEETRAAVERADAAVGSVWSAVASHPAQDDIALLVTTDHGMVPVSHALNVTRILGRHDIQARQVSDGTSTFLYFDDPAAVEPAFEALSGHEAFDVYRRGALPGWARLGDQPRVGDLVISARPPYFTADLSLWPWYAQWLGSWGPDLVPALGSLHATHGYPPGTPGVAGVLYAAGSGVASGRRLPEARVIDVHPTVATLLGIEPGRPVDGRPIAELLE